ncbi:alpha/beta hydrolase fold domain-containing protein [Amycolatopsis keratiniphila]|uniref:Esterase n=1 Tax=Amycolatopsis keratiniphila subsp. keratiniphila TaxID=227715 RepID=A0A1W2M460_9PSEU|nr:alpha/beta hydrolase fold domain-containing protein [Amycolatopsis keratiniphila]ONF74994.1 esterase [Amycolatopsis keratiniphila subsp. keratiniphila]
MRLPEQVIPWYLRAAGRNRAFRSAKNAQAHIDDLALRPRPYAPPRRLGFPVTIDVSRRDGWPVYRVRPADAAPRGSVVYTHGGGWVNEISAEHWRLVAQIAAKARTTVVVPIYPLVPLGTADAVLDAVVDLAREASEQHGEVRLAGDSAGGQITLSAAMVLRDQYNVTLPRTLLISPALDLTCSNPRIPQVQPSDPWLAVPGIRVFADRWRGELPVDDPRVSPLAGDLTGLGPLTVFTGTHDILNPDAHLLRDHAKTAGVEMEFHEEKGLVHVYPLLPTRTGEAARAIIAERLTA